MAKSLSPKRYAQAVFQIASESGELDKWTRDLEVLSTNLRGSKLFEFLDAPQIPMEAKINEVKPMLADSISPVAINLVLLLGSGNISHITPAIAEEYRRLVDSHRNIERGEVVTAIPITNDQRGKLIAILESITGTHITLTTKIDTSIMGGLIAQIGDRVIDGSAKTTLDNMRRSIVSQT